jgi:CRP-like cAMP-binding protein
LQQVIGLNLTDTADQWEIFGRIFHNTEVEDEDTVNGGQVRFIKFDTRLIAANAETVVGPDALSSMELSIDRRPPARLKTERPRLLSELPARLSTDLFAGAELVRLPSGKMLFRAGDPGNGCYRVEDGLLKVTMVSNSGAERILAFLGRGAIVDELAALDGLPRSASVVAVRDATASFVSNAAFEAFAEAHPEIYKSLVRLLARRLRETDTNVAATSFLSLKGRMARTCSSWQNISGNKSRRDGSSSVKRSGRLTSPQWPALHARTSPASSMTGSAAK